MANLSAELYLHGELIGELISNGTASKVTFSEDYLKNDNRKTLSLSIIDGNPDKIELFSNPDAPLPPFIQLLLPEDSPLRERILDESGMVIDQYGFSADAYILMVTGHDLPGALEVRNVKTNGVYDDFRNEIHAPNKSQRRYFSSLSGVQDKFSLKRRKGKFIIPASNENGDFILKPQPLSGRYSTIAVNEYFHMNLAQLCGLNTPEIGIVENDYLKEVGGEHESKSNINGISFYVRRFDRKDGAKIHMEEIFQAIKLSGRITPDSKYNDFTLVEVLSFLNKVSNYYEVDLIDGYMKELCFSILTGNSDFHIKNSAILYKNGIKPEKAPSYDLVNAELYGYNHFALKLSDMLGEVCICDFDNKLYLKVLKEVGIEQRFKHLLKKTKADIIENIEIALRDEVFQKYSTPEFRHSLMMFYRNKGLYDSLSSN